MIYAIRPEDDENFQFKIGTIILHKRYGYNGIIVSRDAQCQADESWYLKNQTQPDRLQPWYHVLVHQAGHHTYVAESNLQIANEPIDIEHPLIDLFFERNESGVYVRNNREWPL